MKSTDIIAVLIELFAEQNGIKIEYELKENNHGDSYKSRDISKE